jgi:ABC-type antimicrobial peptide transport system permease subunit
MEGAFVGVLRIEPLTFVAFAAILSATGLVAALIPARRALTIDPATALRAD